MKFSLIGLSGDGEKLSELLLIAYDLKRNTSTTVDSIEMPQGNLTLEFYKECKEEGLDDVPEPYYSECMEEIGLEVEQEAFKIIDFFRRSSPHQLVGLSYGEVNLVPINHKERVRGVVLMADESDLRPLNDFERSSLIGRAIGLPTRKEAWK